jgi:hypothetical protein
MRMRETGGDAAATDWLKKIPDYQRDSAADVGSRIHALAEQINRGLEPAVSADEAPFIASYRAFLASFRPRFLAVEEMVVSLKHGYAGTFDSVAVIDGQTWLLDLKTGSGVYRRRPSNLPHTALPTSLGGPAPLDGSACRGRRGSA